jgi:hypothetical protein
VTVLKDLVWLLAFTLLLPLWMALGLAFVAVIGSRQMYWWIRGNTTATSRV